MKLRFALVSLLFAAPAFAQSPPPAYGPAPYGPPPAYGPQYQPRPTGFALHQGLTFEANLGMGWIHGSSDGHSDTSDLSLGGLDIGFGGWLTPQLAITGRIAGVTDPVDGGHITSGVIVGGAQYWPTPNVWIGAGIGGGFLATVPDHGTGDSTGGLGLDFRAGYTFNPNDENTFNVSVELTPTFLSENGQSGTFTGVALLLGYQHL